MKRCSNSTRRCSASCSCGLAAAQLLVEEGERLAGLAPVAGQVLLDEEVEQPWTMAAAVLAFWPLEKPEMFDGRADLEHVVGLGGDLDPLRAARAT